MSEELPPHRVVNGCMVPLTDAEIAERAAEEAAYVRPPPRWEVPQLVVVRRLTAAGRLRAALTGLRLDEPAADLTDAELVLRESWRAAATLYSDDADVIAFLSAIGADPAVILARP